MFSRGFRFQNIFVKGSGEQKKQKSNHFLRAAGAPARPRAPPNRGPRGTQKLVRIVAVRCRHASPCMAQGRHARQATVCTYCFYVTALVEVVLTNFFLLARTFPENIFEVKASRKPCENHAKTSNI